MTDCLNCKNCLRTEIYDGQWGRFIFIRECSVKALVIVNGRLVPNNPCVKFEKGEPEFNYITDKEKGKYLY